MNKFLLAAAVMSLSACTITRQAEVSNVDANSGVVRLSYGQAILQSARTDDYLANGTATKQCQQLGYATAVSYGQPIVTCTTTSGSLCLNNSVTIQYQCRGIAITQPKYNGYW